MLLLLAVYTSVPAGYYEQANKPDWDKRSLQCLGQPFGVSGYIEIALVSSKYWLLIFIISYFTYVSSGRKILDLTLCDRFENFPCYTVAQKIVDNV